MTPTTLKQVSLGIAILVAAYGGFFVPSQWFVVFSANKAQIADLGDDIDRFDERCATEVAISSCGGLKQQRAILRELQKLGEREQQSARTDLVAKTIELVRLADTVPNVPDGIGNRFFGHDLADLGNRLASARSELAEIYGDSEPEKMKTVLAAVMDALNRMRKKADSADQAFTAYDIGAVQSATLASSVEKAQNNLIDAQTGYRKAEAYLGERVSKLASRTNELEAVENDLKEKEVRLKELNRESEYHYLAVRAFCLGALGAFAAAIALFLAAAEKQPNVPFRAGRTLLSMPLGGLVSIIVLALFTTREISVFSNPGQIANGGSPDYWRIAILCLVAGAFADRLFAVAQQRVDDYLAQQKGAGSGSGAQTGDGDNQPPQADPPAPKPAG